MAVVVDPFKGAKYPIVIGEELKRNLTAVRFNHKPSQIVSQRTTTLRTSPGSAEAYTLDIQDEDEDGSTTNCVYTGRRSSEDDSFALTYDQEKQHFTLNCINNTYLMNLTSAPWEANTKKLEKQYKQIDLSTDRGAHSSGSDIESELFNHKNTDKDLADPDNPFDYRHYLRGLPKSPTVPTKQRPSPRNSPMMPNGVTRSRPFASAGSAAATPLPAAKKASKAATVISRKDPATANTASTRKRPLPTVRLQRRASVKATTKPSAAHSSDEDDLAEEEAQIAAALSAHVSDDDDNGFILENEPQPRKRQNLGVNQLPRNEGLVSLRSATSDSPASRAASGYEEEDAEDEEAEDDADVDHLHLGTPAHVPRRVEEEQADVQGADDVEEADIAALEKAFEEAAEADEDDDGGESYTAPAAVAPAASAEESEESEEE